MSVAVPISPVSLALRATRAPYTLTSVIPGLAGLAVAIGVDGASWWLAPIAMIALGLAHAGVNLINDVEDFSRGVDAPDKLAASGVFTGGLMTAATGRAIARGLFLTSFAIGVFIAVLQGPALLAIGVAGLLVGYTYSAGPRPLKYAGLGDISIIPVMGPLITQGAYTAVTGDGFDASAFWIGFGPGLLIAAVLGANNLSDIDGDRAAGVRTVAVRFGFSAARQLFVASVVLAFLVPIAVFAAGLLGWAVLLPLLTAPLAVRCLAQVRSHDASTAGEMRTLVPAVAQMHLLFSVLLVVGIVIDRAVV